MAASGWALALGWAPLSVTATACGGAAAAGPTSPAPQHERVLRSVEVTQAEYLTPYGPTKYPFSPAVRVGSMIYLSGQIGTPPGDLSAVVPGGIEAETKQALDNVRDILERSGSSLDRVVKCTAILTDMADWPAMNKVYASYFPTHKPARTAIGANALALGARVEIECWAVASATAR